MVLLSGCVIVIVLVPFVLTQCTVLPYSSDVPAPPPGAGWAPLRIDISGHPLRWDPCAPIGYSVFNQTGAAALVRSGVDDAVGEAATATGLLFIPLKNDDPSPELKIIWVDATPETLVSKSNVAGEALPSGGDRNGFRRYTGGEVRLYRQHHLTGPQWRQVVLHEIGHSLGSAHAPVRDAVMDAAGGGPNHYTANDLAGLRALGRRPGECDTH